MLRWITVRLETSPDALACALAVQTCSSRKPLPTLLPFEYPIVYCFAAALAAALAGAAALAAADGAGVELPEQAPTMTAIAARLAMLLVRLLRFMKLDSSILRPRALIWSTGRANGCVALA